MRRYIDRKCPALQVGHLGTNYNDFVHRPQVRLCQAVARAPLPYRPFATLDRPHRDRAAAARRTVTAHHDRTMSARGNRAVTARRDRAVTAP